MNVQNKKNIITITLSICVCTLILFSRWVPGKIVLEEEEIGAHLKVEFPKYVKKIAVEKTEISRLKSIRLWSDSQIIQQINSSDLRSVIEALFYVWENISTYRNNDNILNAVLTVGLSHDDVRISGLAGLIITMESPSGKIPSVDLSILGNEGESLIKSSETLVAQIDQMDSSAELLVAQEIKEELLLVATTEERRLYISELVEKNDTEMIDQSSQLIRESEEPVKLVITKGLISFLQKGVGDPQKIINVLAENADFLNVQQIEEIREAIARARL